MRSGQVFDIRKFSVHDGPGIRTAVFLKGCPLACLWCHNPEGRDPKPALLRRPSRCIHCGDCARFCPMGLDPKKEAGSAACRECETYGACAEACSAEAIQQVGRMMSTAEVMAILREDRTFYDESGGGVTFSGGEPLAQLSFLLELLDACRSEGIRSAIETSGFTALDSLVDVARRTDLLLYDLKTADPLRGVELTGVDYRRSLDNLSALAMASAADPSLADIVVRMPLVPGMNDSSADLEAAIAFVAALGRDKEGCGSGAEIKAGRVERSYEVHLLPYHSAAKGKYGLWGLDFPLAETKAPDAESLEKAIALFAAGGIAARIGG